MTNEERKMLVWEARREASIEEHYDTHQHKLWIKFADQIEADGKRIAELEAALVEICQTSIDSVAHDIAATALEKSNG